MDLTLFAADLFLLFVLFSFALYGAKAGFAKVLLSFAAAVAAVISAAVLAPAVGEALYDSFAKKALTEYVYSKVSSAGSDITPAVILPESLSSLLQSFGASPALFENSLSLPGETAAGITDYIVEKMAGPALLQTLKMFSAPVLTLIFIIILNFAAIPLNGLIKKLPVIKKCNRALGAVLGGIKGLVAVIVISLILSVAAPLSLNGFLISAVQSSKIIQLVTSLAGIGG